MDIYTLPNVKQIASGGKQPHSTGRSAPCFVSTWRGEIGRVGRRCKQEGIWGYKYTYSDSLCYTAETNTPLKSNYTAIKMLKKFFLKKSIKRSQIDKKRISLLGYDKTCQK